MADAYTPDARFDLPFRAGLIEALDDLAAIQGYLSGPNPMPVPTRDLVDEAIININEVLGYVTD